MPELSLIEYFRRHAPRHPWLTVGPGQDCAVLRWPTHRPVVFKIDQLVEGVHFRLSGPQAATPQEIGWKAVAKTFSDAAAAGCVPIAVEVSLALSANHSEKFVKEIYAGLTACCRKFGAALAGGDFSSSPAGVSLSTAMLAAVPLPTRLAQALSKQKKPTRKAAAPWLRKGGRPGDVLFVTGTLGGSLSGKHLRFTPRIAEAAALRETPGVTVRACIDVTDGLARDLRHLCRESGCGAEIELARLPLSPAARRSAARAPATAFTPNSHVPPPSPYPLPQGERGNSGDSSKRIKFTAKRASKKKAVCPPPVLSALGDGEDFELLFAVAPSAAEHLETRWRHKTPVTRIGKLTPARYGFSLILPDGETTNLPDIGYEHRGQKENP